MAKTSKPREGSLQFWPRKKARKFLPSSNWKALSGEGLLGFIVYKVGMKSAIVKDNTANSMTKGKKIAIPVTILEAPEMKVVSIRYYKNNQVVGEELNENIDKEMKKKIKMPKKKDGKNNKKIDDYDDVRVIVYSQVKKTSIKKTPDVIELGLGGSLEEKEKLIEELKKKEISINDFIKEGIVDVRGLTKGKGIQGPVKRFGVGLKQHKTEKGVRGPGSIGPWHPAYVSFRTPMAGQFGLFKRVQYNQKIVSIKKIGEKDINPEQGFKHFGKIKTSYIILKGSVQGPAKRQILLTKPLRKTKKQEKLNYELIEIK